MQKNYISKKQVDARIALTIEGLKEKFEYLTGAIKIAFPMGLPDYDPITALTKDDQAAKETNMAGMDQDLLDPDTSTLWWAGKEFHRDQTVGDRVGKNEKTKIVARLQSKNAGAPAREPAISEEERKAMMSYWFKKQEEAKQLAEDDDDSFLQREWADPKGLKKSLLGTNKVDWKPK
eukprot:gb/GECG01004743.1/.p1 GENE.gb/GECG01004743.1/~~gb/GECG01004743.1/.p1  ORF type:complete len:177 (+),score=25.95 gb/GECG01004743.1/:1-531(+)